MNKSGFGIVPIEIFGAGLTLGDIAVFTALSIFANERREAWPSLKVLRELLESEGLTISERTIARHISALESAGAISRTKSTDRTGRQNGVRYRLDLLQTNLSARGDKSVSPKGVPNLSPKQTKETDSNKQSPSSPPRDQIDADFEAWWLLVPRKVGKGQARTKYRSARKKVDAATLRAGIERYAALVKRKGTEAQFIAHPATWLHGERWLDEEPPPRTEPDFFEM